MGLQFVLSVLTWSCVVGLVLWWIASAIERSAQAGERIGNARHRDHATVPVICWRDVA
uniref:hypothetical protein n=1 Tax=unclassified Variovorax TaxID=663243 RepID=UPI000D4E5BC2